MSGRSADLVARLELDPTAFVAPGAVVVGAVRLGPRSSVWFNTVVRGDTAAIALGADSNLQDNSTVHVDEGQPAVIGARVTVGHRAIIHGCAIGDDCLVGMGAVVLSGARIGAGSLVGAAALVREGHQIPPGSVVLGAPARVAGQVTDEHRAIIRRGAAHYVELADSYLRRGFGRPHPAAGSVTGISGGERGPMSFVEWTGLLAVLAGSPDWGSARLERHGEERWRRAPGPDRWSALEVVCHLLDADREILLPRLERLLTEDFPKLPDVDMSAWDRERGYRERPPAEALSAWREVRGRVLARLAPLGRNAWLRAGLHSRRGPYPLAEMVRYWADHDLSHRLQMARALGEVA